MHVSCIMILLKIPTMGGVKGQPPPSPKAVPRPIIGYPSVLCLTVIGVIIVVNIITNYYNVYNAEREGVLLLFLHYGLLYLL